MKLLHLLPALLLVVGCAQAEQAAEQAISGAASAAAGAAADEVQRRICDVAGDGVVSVEEQRVLSGLLDTARSAGVPAEIIEPLERIAAEGDQIPADAVRDLAGECGGSPSPAQS